MKLQNGSDVRGVGTGQPNRVDSLRKLAVPKAIENLKLADPKITDAKIDQVVAACDKCSIAMAFIGAPLQTLILERD